LEINSLGCSTCRPAFSRAVIDFLKGSETELCPDCRRRINSNPLRVFDCKVDSCTAIISGAPRILDYLCIDCRDHFSQVQSLLGELNISFLINARMVRGLDYYTKTAFEVKSGALGAQNSVAGGGRYDGLVAFLGGPEIAGIGFAVGFERLLTSLPENEGNVFRTDLFIAALGESAKKFGFKLVNELRRSGIAADMDYGNKSLKSLMKRADKSNSSFALILGDKEIEEKQAQIRNMKTKDQKSLPLDKLQEEIIKIIKGR